MSPARLLARALFLSLLVFASATPAFAQNTAPSPTATAKTVLAQPSAPSISFPTAPPDGFDITKNVSVATAINPDGHAYYFGQRAGLDGWLLVKGKEVEIVYMTADRKTFILGNMFGTEGYNITSDQLRDLLHNVPEAGRNLTEATKEEYGMSGGGGLQANGQPMLPTFRTIGAGGNGGGSSAGPSEGSTSVASEKVPAISPGERLLLDLQDANGVDIGQASAPVIYMIMDPNCPHCKATWRMLRDAVLKNTLRVRLIPIGMNEEDDRASGMLLTVDDPLNAWDKYVAGDKTTLAGTPSPDEIKKVRANHALVDSWSISETPYMAYRSIKTDDMKVIAGEPDHIESIVSDVGQ